MKRYTFEFLIQAQVKQMELGDNYGVSKLTSQEFLVAPIDDTVSPFEVIWNDISFINISIYVDELTVCSNKYNDAMIEITDEFGDLDKVFSLNRDMIEDKFFKILKRINNE